MRRLEEIEEKQDRVLAGSQLETLTTKQVMSVLQIGRTKLTELVQSGELQMWKLGGERRITRAGLEAFIRSKARE
jgi:excisionase family DNA binding protein